MKAKKSASIRRLNIRIKKLKRKLRTLEDIREIIGEAPSETKW